MAKIRAKEFYIVSLFRPNSKEGVKFLFISSDEDEAYSEYERLKREKGYGVSVLGTSLEFIFIETKRKLSNKLVKKRPDIIHARNNREYDTMLECTGIYVGNN